MPNKQKDSQPTDKTQSRIEKYSISEKDCSTTDKTQRRIEKC